MHAANTHPDSTCRAYVAQYEKNPNGPSGPFQQMAEDWEADNEGTLYDYCVQLIADSGPGNSNGKGNKG